MDLEKRNRLLAFALAFGMFFFGFLIVWFGTNEALLAKLANPKLVEFSSEGIGAALMLASTWLIFKKCK